MIFTLSRCIIVFILLVFTGAASADGMDSARTNVIKAGMINGFTAYTTWPNYNINKPFVIGVLGADKHFIPALQRFFKRKPVTQFSSIEIKEIQLSQVTDCQVVILLGQSNQYSKEVLQRIGRLPILTISDNERFAYNGGHVSFYNENNKLRFAINWKSTTNSRLKVSSRLLRLARLVGGKP